MKLPSPPFNGEMPQQAPEHLPAGYAAIAQNVRLLSGRLESWFDLASQGAPAKAASGTVKAMHWMDVDASNGGPFLLHWTASEITGPKADVARSLIGGDTTDRTYYTGIGQPRVTNRSKATDPPPPGVTNAYPYRDLFLGVPAPTSAPTLEVLASLSAANEITISNPGAEDGTLFWTVNSGTLTSIGVAEVPSLAPYAGTKYFSAGTAASTDASQALTASSVGIGDGQQLTVNWRQAKGPNASKAALKLAFLDASDVLISEVSADQIAPSGANYIWNLRSLVTTVPSNTEKVRIHQLYTKVGAGDTDAYIDDIHLLADDQAATFDGSTLSGWTPSPYSASSGGRGGRNVSIDTGFGFPAPAFRFDSDDAYPWMHRPMNTADYTKVQSSYEVWFPNGNESSINELSFLPYATSGGIGDGLYINRQGSVQIIRQTGGWDRDISGLQTLRTGSGLGDRKLRVTLTTTKKSESKASVTVKIEDANSGEVIVADTLPVNDFAIDGGEIGYKAFSHRQNTPNCYVDNVSILRAGVRPDEEVLVSTSYVYTFVSELGDESAPSPPSQTITRDDDSSVKVTTATTATAGHGITKKRIYRAAGDPAAFLLVEEITLATADYTDSKADSALGEELEPTEDWVIPPADGHSILTLANGITVLASQNQLCPSPIGRAHAYPTKWRKPADFKLVALAAMDTDVIVLTQGTAYIAIGSDPSALDMAKLEKTQGCISGRSAVTIPGVGVCYATSDGIAAVSRGAQFMATAGLVSEKEWAAFNPASILAVQHDGRYIGFWENGANKGGFILDPRKGSANWTRLDFHATAVTVNQLTGKLNLVIDGIRYIWDGAATKRPYVYESGDIITPNASFEAARLRLDETETGSVTFKWYVDGVLNFTKAVSSSTEFLLPAKEAQQKVKFRLEGSRSVKTWPLIVSDMREMD